MAPHRSSQPWIPYRQINSLQGHQKRGLVIHVFLSFFLSVKSAINNLEHRGLDRVQAKGREGFARMVALSVASLNVHRLGRLVRVSKRGNNIVSQPDAGETSSLIRPANCGNQRVFPTMIEQSRNRRSERIGSRS